jgi:hypothetical protein
MNVAPQLDTSWLLSVQRKLYELSRTNPDYAFEKLWGLITDPRNLRIAVLALKRGAAFMSWLEQGSSSAPSGRLIRFPRQWHGLRFLAPDHQAVPPFSGQL